MKPSQLTMDACQAYRLQLLTLRCLTRNWRSKSSQYIETLNNFYDAGSKLPMGCVLTDLNPELAAEGLKAELDCANFDSKKRKVVSAIFDHQKASLLLIGKDFGALMQADSETALSKRFTKFWRLANGVRKNMLDGVALTPKQIDPNGPMFKEFSKAAGYRKPDDFLSALITSDRAGSPRYQN
jgi:hypothetical protein